VFPAIRKNAIEFYYHGRKLFKYDSNLRFSTNRKYASVVQGQSKPEVFESELEFMHPIKSFKEGYQKIKKMCKIYSEDEASGVAKAYNHSSYASSTPQENICVLDIEIAFGKEQNDSYGTSDDLEKSRRIDLLLYNVRERKLRFFEAKRFRNGELWSPRGVPPRVISQLRSYNDILGNKENRKHILEEYTWYLQCMKPIIGRNILEPNDIYPEVVLLIFGFDRWQIRKMNELLLEDHSLSGFWLRRRGSIDCRAEEIWNNAVARQL
jgi:hypothetical protein